VRDLYPPIEPYDHGLLDVGDGNHVYWEACGRPDGKPAVMVHGGPGQGCAPRMRQMFDPGRYRAVLFDQRGCGRSTPHASDPATSLARNTTDDLVADMERLREHLGIDRWTVVGGSWGTTLGLVYAERHPERVSEIMMSAICTSRPAEADWLYRGLAQFFPEAWARFRDAAGGVHDTVPELAAAYAALISDPDPAVRNAAAASWRWWEDTVLSLEPGAGPAELDEAPGPATLAFARITAHYCAHDAWLPDNAVIGDAGRLADIPGVLMHGRQDLSCPARTAWELAESWPGVTLLMDDHSGHRGNALKRHWMVETLDQFARR
jgi:proline iminopeptidase